MLINSSSKRSLFDKIYCSCGCHTGSIIMVNALRLFDISEVFQLSSSKARPDFGKDQTQIFVCKLPKVFIFCSSEILRKTTSNVNREPRITRAMNSLTILVSKRPNQILKYSKNASFYYSKVYYNDDKLKFDLFCLRLFPDASKVLAFTLFDNLKAFFKIHACNFFTPVPIHVFD